MKPVLSIYVVIIENFTSKRGISKKITMAFRGCLPTFGGESGCKKTLQENNFQKVFIEFFSNLLKKNLFWTFEKPLKGFEKVLIKPF